MTIKCTFKGDGPGLFRFYLEKFKGNFLATVGPTLHLAGMVQFNSEVQKNLGSCKKVTSVEEAHNELNRLSTEIGNVAKNCLLRLKDQKPPFENIGNQRKGIKHLLTQTIEQSKQIPPRHKTVSEKSLYLEQAYLHHFYAQNLETLFKELGKFVGCAPTLFISYAWPSKHRPYEKWIQSFLRIFRADLGQCNMVVSLDIDNSHFGNNSFDHMHQIEFVDHVLLMGSESLVDKHLKGMAHSVCYELNLIRRRYTKYIYGNHTTKPPIIPFLLSGNLDDAFPMDVYKNAVIGGRTDEVDHHNCALMNNSYLQHVRQLLRYLLPLSHEQEEKWDLLWDSFTKQPELKELYQGLTAQQLTVYKEKLGRANPGWKTSQQSDTKKLIENNIKKLKTLAAQGNGSAAYLLAEHCRNETVDVEPESQRQAVAIKYLKQAADMNIREALFDLAVEYSERVEKITYITRAADLKLPEAQVALAKSYFVDANPAVNLEKASQALQAAAQQGDPQATFAVAAAPQGQPVPKEVFTALDYHQKLQDSPAAEFKQELQALSLNPENLKVFEYLAELQEPEQLIEIFDDPLGLVDRHMEHLVYTDKQLKKKVKELLVKHGSDEHHHNFIHSDGFRRAPALLEIAHIPHFTEPLLAIWLNDQESFASSLTLLYKQLLEGTLAQKFPSEETVHSLLHALSKMASQINDLGPFMVSDLYSSGVIKKESPPQLYSFLHPSFQEYFQALYLAQQPKEQRDAFILNNRSNPANKQILIFLCGLLCQADEENVVPFFETLNRTPHSLTLPELIALNLQCLNECVGYEEPIPVLDDFFSKIKTLGDSLFADSFMHSSSHAADYYYSNTYTDLKPDYEIYFKYHPLVTQWIYNNDHTEGCELDLANWDRINPPIQDSSLVQFYDSLLDIMTLCCRLNISWLTKPLDISPWYQGGRVTVYFDQNVNLIRRRAINILEALRDDKYLEKNSSDTYLLFPPAFHTILENDPNYETRLVVIQALIRWGRVDEASVRLFRELVIMDFGEVFTQDIDRRNTILQHLAQLPDAYKELDFKKLLAEKATASSKEGSQFFANALSAYQDNPGVKLRTLVFMFADKYFTECDTYFSGHFKEERTDGGPIWLATCNIDCHMDYRGLIKCDIYQYHLKNMAVALINKIYNYYK